MGQVISEALMNLLSVQNLIFVNVGIFIGIILVLYFCCILIYQQYSKKKGEFYTKSLQAYQEKRKKENDKPIIQKILERVN